MEFDVQPWQLYLLIIVCGLSSFLLLATVMHSEDNQLEWWQFISSRGKDGKQYADLTKLGQVVGILLCIAVVFIFAARKDTTIEGFSLLFGVILLYLGGVQAYQTYMKNKDASKPTEEPDK